MHAWPAQKLLAACSVLQNRWRARLDASRWLVIDVTGVRIGSIVGERFTIPDEILEIPCGNGKPQCLTTSNAHVGDANDFTTGIEEWATAVARVDWRVGLDVGQPIKVTLGG